jgi:hypothetical protein
MATEWISPTWRMPENSNQSKVDNYSLDFGGVTNQRISIAASDDIIPTNAKMSISAWIYMDTSAVGVGRTIFSNGKDNSGAKEYMFEVDTNDNLLFTVRTLVGSPFYVTITGGTTISLNTWHHVAITWDGANLNLYLNGASDASPVAATSFYTNGTNDAPFIGVRRGGAGSYYSPWAGRLGQICYYNTGLSASQITTLYNSGTPVNPMALTPLPIAYYPLGDSSTGSVSTLTTPNESVPSATVFNFDTDYITFDSSSFGDSSFSVSIWMNQDSGTGYQPLFAGSGYSGGDGIWIGTKSNKIQVWVSVGGSSTKVLESAAASIVFNTWNNIVVKRESSVGWTLYLNGASVDTETSSILTDDLKSANSNLGKHYNSASYFVGEMANVQIWDTNLSGANVTTLYNNGVPLYTGTQPEAANLQLWYKMNVDTSTWNGTDWVIGDSTANYSSALDFDGVADYVELDSLVNLGTVHTISWWEKSDGSDREDFIANPLFSSGINGPKPSVLFYKAAGVSSYMLNGSAQPLNVDLNDDKWHNISIVRNGASLDFYIDGLPQVIALNALVGTEVFEFNSIMHPTAVGRYSKGTISNLAVFTTNLSAANIITLYNNGTPQTSPSFSPTGWWKLDNTTTGIEDSAGSNNGTNNGAAVEDIQVSTLNGTSDGMTTANLVTSDLTRSIPYSSYSMTFDGTADYIDVGVITNTSTLTISAWINSDDLTSTQCIVSDGANSNIGYRLEFGRTDETFSWVHAGSVVSTANASAITTTGTWHNIIAIRTGSAGDWTIEYYVDGASWGSTTGITTDPDSTVDNTALGSRGDGSGLYFNGKMSNVAMWSSALTEDQILTIYNGGVPNSISSLSPLGWWSLAGDSYFDGTNWICPDLGSAGNNGTSTGMGGTELVGDGPGSTVNGTASGYMNFIDDLKGDAPNSTSNAFSINMNPLDRVTSVPG